MTLDDDNQIMLSVKNGDVSRLGILFERYHGSLLGYFIRLSGDRTLSEDLVQETFCRMLRYRNTFKVERSFRSWMFQIGRNLFYDQMKRQAFERERLDRNLRALPDLDERAKPSTEELERAERVAMLQQALSELSPKKREIIILSRFENLPQVEMAEILECSVSAVKARLFRAIKSLQEVYLKISGEKAS